MHVPQINCKGTAYEIGRQHGSGAAELVRGSIRFYDAMFNTYTGKTWAEITLIAEQFGRNIEATWPRYYQEMQGIADGAGCTVADILALNTRTEIVFGLMVPERVISDGCTSLCWTDGQDSWMGQNWDWMEEQGENLVFLTIDQENMPTIKMVTEAGIIGKIGMNSAGVAVCLNAVRCGGHDMTRLPIHLALRMCLESDTVTQAVDALEATGSAGSAFLLLAQGKESLGLEMTSKTVKRMQRDALGRIMHTNHLLLIHEGCQEWPEADSFSRFERMVRLTDEHSKRRQDGAKMTAADMLGFFDDHDGAPFGICRSQEGQCLDATLFNIIMNLDKKSAVVRRGKLCNVQDEIYFSFA